MDILRTPDERFAELADYPFEPHYSDVGDGLRMHHVEQGSGRPVLLLHGQPSWSYLYRTMIPLLATAGFRAIAPDLIGFGKSDKPTAQSDYTYSRHVRWLDHWFDLQDLHNVILFCQDWGGLLGLRLVAAHPDRFAGVVASNTGLPTGDQTMSEAFIRWRDFVQSTRSFDIGRIIQGGTVSELTPATVAAYNAPYPDESYKAGARAFPSLVPASPDDPEAQPNRDAWSVLVGFDKPVVTAFGDSDPITAGTDKALHKLIRGAHRQPHTTVKDAGHFIQEDQPDELVRIITDLAEALPD